MGKLGQWLKNARSLSLVQSLMPAVLAVVMAIGSDGFSIVCALAALLGVACAHLSMNLADDYFDYRVDMLGDRDRVIRKGFRAMTVKYPYLTDGSESPATLRKAILSFGAVAVLAGAIIFTLRTLQSGFLGIQGTWWIVAIATVTIFLGIFYSAPPLKLAYRGLGELIIGVIFGPLLMAGVFYSCAGCLSEEIFWISIPVGLLVLNILYTHSFIDKAGDAECGKMTFALLLGSDRAGLIAAFIFNLLPFIMIAAAVIAGVLHPLYLLVLLILPRAVWLCASLRAFAAGKQDVPARPPFWLGKMMDWEGVRSAGVDWFLMRWLTARNTLSGFCFAVTAAKLILIIFNVQ